MDGQTPTPPNTTQPIQPPSPKRGRLFEIFFVVIVLILVFGILNYFNILRLSEIFPNQLGFLPHKQSSNETMKQLNNVTITPTLSPTDQAKQMLINFLPTVTAPSFLPQSSSDITLTEDKADKEKLIASWSNKGEGRGTLWAIFPNPSGSKKITSLDVFFEKIQTTSPSVELAKSAINQVFPTEPKGEWVCKNTPNERRRYCENFWEEKDSKKGLGFTTINTSQFRGRLIYSFCEHTKESNLYSWKSCRSEFAESGVK